MKNISKEGIAANNLLFLLLDVTELLQSIAEREAKQANGDWERKQIKPLMNQFKWIRKDLLKAVRKCEMCTQEDFGDDSDNILKLLVLMSDRVGSNEKKMDLIFNFIESLSSEEKMNLNKFGI